MLQTRRPDIYALINNAGFGLLGNLIERDYPGQADIVNVNCRAAAADLPCAALYAAGRVCTQYLFHFLLCAQPAYDGLQRFQGVYVPFLKVFAL